MCRTDRAEIERLLNQTGRTLEGLPKCYASPEAEAALTVAGGSRYHAGSMLLYQSDVIELLVGALRDALDKQPKWISVKERLPETPGHYLCWLAFAERPTPMHVSYLGDGKWTLPARLISHWSEPMEPPKEDAHE